MAAGWLDSYRKLRAVDEVTQLRRRVLLRMSQRNKRRRLLP